MGNSVRSIRSFDVLVRGACVIALAAGLAACEQLRGATGQTKNAPDEFRVVSRAPLAVPPDFTLRPPRPGADRPQEGSTTTQAREALTGAGRGTLAATAGNPRLSTGETALLRQAGAVGIDPTIRQVINRESDVLAEQDRTFTDRLVFWREPQPPGLVVDPDREARRLREASGLGRPANDGPVPTIERRQRGLLEGIF